MFLDGEDVRDVPLSRLEGQSVAHTLSDAKGNCTTYGGYGSCGDSFGALRDAAFDPETGIPIETRYDHSFRVIDDERWTTLRLLQSETGSDGNDAT